MQVKLCASKSYFTIATSAASDEIHEFIQDGINAGDLDVDGDGYTTALGDGLMVIRRLFGSAFAGDALISKIRLMNEFILEWRRRLIQIGFLILIVLNQMALNI